MAVVVIGQQQRLKMKTPIAPLLAMDIVGAKSRVAGAYLPASRQV